jgi:hypothetical protein
MTHLWKRAVPHLVFVSLLTAPVAITGCAARGGYRAYDPDDGSYHQWNHVEVSYYSQWENETHRRHKDYRKRDQDEQRQYWQWRKQHEDHDHNERGSPNHH